MDCDPTAAPQMTRTPMPEACQGDLLHEPCIGIADRQCNRERLSLPAVLARLSDPGRSTLAFNALQSHQTHAWHAFLVQLAAMVCQRADLGISDAACRSAEWWTERLLALADGCAEAWCLVVEDRGKPAFMQVPVSGDIEDYKTLIPSPRELDVLVTTRNHDAKAARGRSEHWLFALVALQTLQGYLGRGNYGVFRMNGGPGNRFAVGFADPGDLGAWFRRDVAALVTERATTITGGGFADHDGSALLWLSAWDGSESSCIGHAQLDPWCIEICRRLRLVPGQNAWHARQATSNAERTRIAKTPKKGGGQEWVIKSGFGDPWMALADAKAITPMEQGFTADKTVEYLLDPGTTAPPAQQMLPEDIGSDLHWYGRTLVRGQGKTNGWHERLVPIPANLRRHWRDQPEERARAAERARTQLEDAASLRGKVLRPALLVLNQAGGRDAGAWLAGFEARCDAAFFEHLWDHLEAEKDEACRSWRRTIIAQARRVLSEAQAAIPDGVRRWRALATSQLRFDDGLKATPSRSDSFAGSLREAVPQEQV